MQAPDFWRNEGLLARLALPASFLWTLAGRAARSRARPQRVGIPVVCVGNVVAGGAGKTPVALAISESLTRLGHAPHFLTRGYGGSLAGPVRVDPSRHGPADVGDEPLLLAAAAPTWAARDRLAGARAAAAAGADVIVMDDGFQNMALAKNLSVLVIDGGYGFGNGRVIPAGPLREPVGDAVARANAAIIVGADLVGVERTLAGRLPVLAARFVPLPVSDGIGGQRVLAFAGIGRPSKFFETLAGMGCEIVAARPFPDHHRYTEDEVTRLIEAAAAANAVPVTTEKDHVRLPPAAQGLVEMLRVTLEWREPEALDKLVALAFETKA